MSIYYGTSRKVRVGDRIRYAGSLGRVVFIVEDDLCLPEYSEELRGWKASNHVGVGLEMDDGVGYILSNIKEEEDLEPFDEQGQ